mmetsp:Transcript_22991/g.70650  ORF Transcript_22991/g.70650 Transcript_22991/m.70650 type:complete len:336 (-) Transcript_22991:1786-2793(-)
MDPRRVPRPRHSGVRHRGRALHGVRRTVGSPGRPRLRRPGGPALRVLELGRRPVLVVRVGWLATARVGARLVHRTLVSQRRAFCRPPLLHGPSRAQHAGGHGAPRRVERQLPRPRRARRGPVRPRARALPGARAAARNGEQRQVRHHRRPAPRLHDGRNRLRRAGHQRPTFLLPAPAHGPGRARRLPRLPRAPRRSLLRRPRRARRQLARPTRRPGPRTLLRGRRQRRPHRRRRRHRLVRPQNPERRPALFDLALPAPRPRRRRRHPRPLRTPHRRPGLRLEHQFLGPVRRRARQDPGHRHPQIHRQRPRQTQPLQPLHRPPPPPLLHPRRTLWE